MAPALRALARWDDVPARWRHGLLAGVDYSARSRYGPPPALYQRLQNRLGPVLIGLGIGPEQVMVLEVPGRRSGVIRGNAVVRVSHNSKDYLVALAGESEWVRNVRASHGQAVIGRRQRRGRADGGGATGRVTPNIAGPTYCVGAASRTRPPSSAKLDCSSGSAAIHVQELSAIAEFYPVFRIDYVNRSDAT